MGKTEFVHASDLGKLPPLEFLGDSHFVKRGLNVLFGLSGTCKSFYMLHHSLAISRTEPVIYIAAEGSSGLNQRVLAWCQRYNTTPSEHQLYFVCKEVNLMDKPSIYGLLRDIQSFTPTAALVVFDTYARCREGGVENAADDTNVAVNNCAILQRELSAAVCLVHHTDKSGKWERGSGALRGACDSMVRMEATEESVQVMFSKLKDGSDWPTEYYSFLPVGASGVLVPADEVPPSLRLSNNEVRVLELLALEVFKDAGAQSRQIIEATGIAAATIYRILSMLKVNSHVQQDKRGDPYSITLFGRNVLREYHSHSKGKANFSEETGLGATLTDSHGTIN